MGVLSPRCPMALWAYYTILNNKTPSVVICAVNTRRLTADARQRKATIEDANLRSGARASKTAKRRGTTKKTSVPRPRVNGERCCGCAPKHAPFYTKRVEQPGNRGRQIAAKDGAAQKIQRYVYHHFARPRWFSLSSIAI